MKFYVEPLDFEGIKFNAYVTRERNICRFSALYDIDDITRYIRTNKHNAVSAVSWMLPIQKGMDIFYVGRCDIPDPTRLPTGLYTSYDNIKRLMRRMSEVKDFSENQKSDILKLMNIFNTSPLDLTRLSEIISTESYWQDSSKLMHA